MVRYAAQDPLSLKYQRLVALDTGYNIDQFKRGGVFMVVNPACADNSLPAGTYIVETLEGVLSGRQLVFQCASSVTTGTEYTRHGDGNTWEAFEARGTGGGPGGPVAADDVSYDDATESTPGLADNVQAAIEELIANVYPQGLASRIFDVRRYGADPTGVVECGQAFEDAIIACAAAGGGTIYAPAGTYRLGYRGTASVGAIRLRNNMCLAGDGQGITILQLEDIGNNDLTGIVRTQSGTVNNNIVVRDLTIDGNIAAQTGWANIIGFFAGVTPGDRVNKDTDIWCINVEIKNCRSGTTGSSNPGRGYGFDPHEVVDRFYMLNCTAHDNGLDGAIFDGVLNFQVIGCRSYNNGRHGFNCVKESFHGLFYGCRSEDNGSNNFLVQQDSHHITFDAVFSKGSGEQGVRFRSGETITNVYNKLNNSTILESGRNGVNITGAKHCTVMNNTIVNSSASADNTYFDIALDEDDGDGMVFTGAQYNLIAGNKCVVESTATNKAKGAIREDDAATAPPSDNTYRWNDAIGHLQGKYIDITSNSTIIDAGYGAVYEAVHHGVSPANADNGTALRDLVDLVEARGGGAIVLPIGTINASGTGTASQGVVSLPNGVNLIGAGPGLTILNCLDPVNNDVSGVVRTRSGGTSSGIIVADMTITAEDPSGTGGIDLLFLGGTSDTDFKGINLDLFAAREAGTGKYGCRVSATSVRATFVNCVARSCERDGFYDQGTETTFLNCSSTGNVRHGFNASDSTKPQFIGCRSYNNGTNQLIIEDTLHAKVMGGDYDANSVNNDCVRIKGGSITDMYAHIQGATIRNSGRDGLSIAGSNRNTVTGNTFLDNGRQTNNTYHDVAIELDTAVTSSYNVISNNTMVSTAANKTRAGVNEVSTCNHNHAIFNTFSGQVTSPVVFTGANSVRFDTSYQNITDGNFAAGTETLPSIHAVGDPNTGLWFSTADTINVSTNGVERIEISPIGTFGFNTAAAALVSENTFHIAQPAGNTTNDTRLVINNSAGNRAAITQTNANDHITMAMGATGVATLGNRWGLGMSGSAKYAIIVEHGGFPSTYHMNVGVHVEATSALHPFTVGESETPLSTNSMVGIYRAGLAQIHLRNTTNNIEAFFAANTGSVDIGSASAHELRFFAAGTPLMRFTGSVLRPESDGTVSLGDTTYQWNGLHLNATTAISWENGDVTLTHATNALTFAGGNLFIPSNSLSIGTASNPADLTVYTGDQEIARFLTSDNLGYLSLYNNSGTNALIIGGLGAVGFFQNVSGTEIEMQIAGGGATAKLRAGELSAQSDHGGKTGFVSISGTTDLTANSTGVGQVRFKGATSRESAGFLKVYVGTTAYYVPMFSAITG